MDSQTTPDSENTEKGVSRRDFLKQTGGLAFLVCIAGSSAIVLADGKIGLPVSKGYLLVDTKKCQGCMSCMLACSLVHEGEENLSLSRIQILQNPFGKFPDDLTIEQCRQCVDPSCLKACSVGALFIDTQNNNVRRIDEKKCVGCMKCVEACPFHPGRAIWDFLQNHSQKCDLCVDAPFWKKEVKPTGKHACIEICPMGAIQFSENVPKQEGDEGYKINLRGPGWKRLGYTIS